jgi:hypothetical protein
MQDSTKILKQKNLAKKRKATKGIESINGDLQSRMVKKDQKG